MKLSYEQRLQISTEVALLVEKSSQKKVANEAGVSNATISNMVRKAWDNISDEMFKRVEVNLLLEVNWKVAPTENFKLVYELLGNAKLKHMSIAISEDAGRGKSAAFRAFKKANTNVVYIECKNAWSKKSFVRNLASQSGLSNFGTTEEILERFVAHIKGMSEPIIIFDQFDKLKDPQRDLFMDFYNDLPGCAFVLSGVKALEKSILKGVSRDKIGYAELFSRIGRKFIRLNPLSPEDVTLVCQANGVQDPELIDYIYGNSEGDLRRVRRDIEIYQLKQQAVA